MAGFKTHITTSSVLGVGYTGLGLYQGLPIESALIAGGLCGVGGMLPDIDSDSGIPFRESMGFAAAIVPILLLDRFREFNLNTEQIVLISGAMYLFVRFGIARLLAKYTVHRGMFHSLPAAVTFAGVAFLLCRFNDNLQLRYFISGGVLLGVMSHLMLDEIYSVEWSGGRWRFKKSFGTAMKLWGNNLWSNLSTYAKLVIVILMILGEPMVMERYGQLSPVVLQRDNWTQHFARTPDEQQPQPFPMENQGGIYPPDQDGQMQSSWQPIEPQSNGQYAVEPPVDSNIYDTARRLWNNWNNEQPVQDPNRR